VPRRGCGPSHDFTVWQFHYRTKNKNTLDTGWAPQQFWTQNYTQCHYRALNPGRHLTKMNHELLRRPPAQLQNCMLLDYDKACEEKYDTTYRDHVTDITLK